jgi:hypothetical protein
MAILQFMGYRILLASPPGPVSLQNIYILSKKKLFLPITDSSLNCEVSQQLQKFYCVRAMDCYPPPPSIHCGKMVQSAFSELICFT